MIRVEITGDFEGDEVTQGALEEYADEIREALRHLQCPEHGVSPSVRLSVHGDEIGVDVGGCCEVLQEQTRQVLDRLSEESEPREG